MTEMLKRIFNEARKYLQQRKRAYQLCFGSPAGQEVLRDLEVFCRAKETCFHDDARKNAVLEGRREVWLRIADHLHLSTDQLYALYNGKTITVVKPEGEDDEL